MFAALLLCLAASAMPSAWTAPDLSPVMMERPCREGNVVLVAEGRANLPIIAAEGRRERKAAYYLAGVIHALTGVRPSVYVEAAGQHVALDPALRIARADDAARFRVITKNGSVRFLGRSDWAVYDWCERVLGVRNFIPNAPPSCCRTLVVPQKSSSATLAVPAVDYADAPVFDCRTSGADYTWRNRLKSGDEHRGGVAVHAPHRWYLDPDVRTNHPNIFARQPDGSRGEMPLLCYGNPETLAYYKERIDAHIAGLRDSGGIVDTNRHVITVSPWDCRVECTCPHCQRLFDPSMGVSGSASPIVWGYFLKDLARWAAAMHPGYVVAFLPYLNTCDVPPGLDLTEEGNCEAMLCSMPGLALFKEPSVRAHEEALICDWARVTGRKVLNWHYGCWPREFTSAPYLYGKTIARHYRRVGPLEIGSFDCGGSGPACELLATYVWHRCLWNPAVDVDAIYDTFADRMFGPAAGPMRRLMTLQEEGWERPWNDGHVSCKNIFDISYTAQDVAEMKRLLCEAAEKAQDDPAALDHVHWYADDFATFFADEARYRQGIAFEPLVMGHAERAPIVDGELGDACWSQAAERIFVPAFGTDTLVRATSVRAVATEKGVYFGFRCDEPAMTNLNFSAAYGEIQKQDTLELFIDASGTATGTCHRLMFDVRNRLSVTASDVEWAPKGVVSAVTRGVDQWTLEVFVPFAAFSGPVSRTSWRGNFTRWHYDIPAACERSRLSTLGSEWNQDRDAFTTFILPDVLPSHDGHVGDCTK